LTGFIIKKKWNAKELQEHYIFLCSDLHLDSPAHDRKLLVRELDRALELDADIIIGGDVFDALLPGDRKRHTPSSDNIDTQGYDT